MSSPQALYQIFQNGYKKQLLEEKEKLIISEASKLKVNHYSILLTLTKISFPPREALRIFLEVVKALPPDPHLYKKVASIIQEISPELEIDQIVENYPNEDIVTRGLIIGIIPVPLESQYVRFVFDAATSQYVINRIAFLKYIERTIESEFPSQYLRLLNGVLESLSNDQSHYVRAAWIKPALFYLKENPHIRGFIKRMTDPNEAIEVRISLAFNFKLIYELSPTLATKLMQSTEPRVLAALLPHLEKYNFSFEDTAKIYECKDSTIRVFIVRFLGFKKKELIDEFINSESNEVINETIKWLGNHPEYSQFLLKLIQITSRKEKKTSLNWRTNYELLSIPKDLIVSLGMPMYELAEKCVFRHPNILMKQACEVVQAFASSSSDFVKRKYDIIRKLKAENTQYANIGISILEQETTNQ